jgi:membrane associated rhomboid family serine protease
LAFIPLYDGNPLRYIGRPYVAWSLILINVVVYFVVESGSIADSDQATAISFGLIPAVFNNLVARPDALAEVPDWLTLLTYAFFHGDIWHLLGNMIFLWVFADNIEDSLGHGRFLAFYFLCAIGSGYVYVLSDPSSQAPVIGASGAIAGIVAAYFILYPYAKIWILAFGRIPLHLNAIWVLGFWIAFQIYAVLSNNGAEQVAWWSHIGGLAIGAVLVIVMRRRGVALFNRAPAVTVAVPGAVDEAETRRYGPPPPPGPWSP